MTDLAALKARMPEIVGIDELTETVVGGRRVFGFNGLIAAVDLKANETEIEATIRKTAGLRNAVPVAEPVTTQPKGQPMSSVTGARSASMSLKQMMEQAKQSVADGMAEVQAGIDKHARAGAALKTLGSTLNHDGDDLLATVGQFTNDLG